MSEVQSGGGGSSKKGGKIRSKKSSTKIDMTPMVDLAFLLLTFFMLTATFNKPQTMEITMPEDPKEGDIIPKVNEDDVLTLILGKGDKVFWYTGIKDPVVTTTNFAADGVRKVLLQYKSNKKLVVLIKPDETSKYRNLVDILDEMTITQTRTYAIVDITPEDQELVKEFNQ